LGVFFLGINLSHIFLSQSVRYYTLLLSFEALTVYWFFRGFEERRVSLLLLSHLALVAAMLTHFSAVLVVPVLIAYLALAWLLADQGSRYGSSSYLWFGLPLGAILVVFAHRILSAQQMMGSWALPSARSPVHILITAVAYFGAPLMLLGTLRLVRPGRMSRALLLMGLVAWIPMLELLTIASLNVINVTWYYAFISVVGFAVLAADWVVTASRRGALAWAWAGSAAIVLSSVGLLTMYFTVAHGDRPRWRDAAAFMTGVANVPLQGDGTPEIFASAPAVMNFYLGVSPGATQQSQLVRQPPKGFDEVLRRDQWYVIPEFELSVQQRTWFNSHCALRATFDARTGPRDRSLFVYQCLATSS
jgi:hypothetical protein